MSKWLQLSNPKIIQTLKHSVNGWNRLLKIRHRIDLACLIILAIAFLFFLIIRHFMGKRVQKYQNLLGILILLSLTIIMAFPILEDITYSSSSSLDYGSDLIVKYKGQSLSNIFLSSRIINCNNILVKHPTEITKVKQRYQRMYAFQVKIRHYNQLRVKNVQNTKKWKLYNRKYQTIVEAYHVAFPRKTQKKIRCQIRGIRDLLKRSPHIII